MQTCQGHRTQTSRRAEAGRSSASVRQTCKALFFSNPSYTPVLWFCLMWFIILKALHLLFIFQLSLRAALVSWFQAHSTGLDLTASQGSQHTPGSIRGFATRTVFCAVLCPVTVQRLPVCASWSLPRPCSVAAASPRCP